MPAKQVASLCVPDDFRLWIVEEIKPNDFKLWIDMEAVKFEGKSLSWWPSCKKVKVLPGKYTVRWTMRHSGFIQIGGLPSSEPHFVGQDSWDAKSGREYCIHYDYVLSGGADVHLWNVSERATWIEDMRTKEVVAGTKPPWAESPW